MSQATRGKLDDLQWTLRISRRSRYARLQVKPFGGLEVVIPPHFPRRQIEPFILQHRGWIKQKLAEQQLLQDTLKLPNLIKLALDQSDTPIIYGNQTNRGQSDAVIIHSEEKESRIEELRNWIRRRAWELLPPMLEEISEQIGIDYRKVSIRSQKTRWGSCSSNGTISLNDQLLFLERPAVEYLMIHELCHRRVMNHSPAFWELVKTFCPDYRLKEKIIDRGKQSVPAWFLASLYN